MRNRTKMMAAAAAVAAALAAGSTVAAASGTATASGTGAKPAKTVAASEKQGHDAMVAAVARELNISTARVAAALQPLFAAGHADTSSPAFAAAAGAKAAEEQQGHDAMVAAVARELNISTARVAAALQPLFAAGHADTSSPAFAAAARALGVSTDQLNTALMHAKQSLAQGS